MKHSSHNICVLPWVHVNLNPNGEVVPCCVSTNNYVIGDLNNQPIEDIWNSPRMVNLRQQFLDGKKPKICTRCFSKEETGVSSNRQHSNEKFAKELAEIKSPIADLNLLHWDFRFSNLCNFKCRSCGPEFSSSWIPDSKKLGRPYDDKILKNKESNIYNLIDKNIFKVKRIYFAGGEPLLMDEHWYILSELDRLGRHDVVLEYNTNMSTLKRGNKHVFDYWKKFDVRLWPSIDEIHERAEIIRSGTQWNKVEENLKEVIAAGIEPSPSITVSVMNVHRLRNIIDHLVNIGIRIDKIGFNMLHSPAHYNISVMNNAAKQKTLSDIMNMILDYRLQYNFNMKEKLQQIIAQLKTPQDCDGSIKLEIISHKIDIIRKENLFNSIPELKSNVQIDENMV